MDKAYRKPDKKNQISHWMISPEMRYCIEFRCTSAEMLASNGFAKNVQ